ncbi:metallophosphoesterase [Myroides sp. WP-1]|uniref:metallophosphoesterase n=1 Tax=Myroides sp. WP-1 TaxID=2759944 RepID=UPI0015FC6CDD|nr:metallophosphoesterase [Myroides sp. WP-1]MBB1139054.1 metallophosphoesterase [Myroides sp. WP-1]
MRKKIYGLFLLWTTCITAQEVKIGVVSDPHLHQIYLKEATTLAPFYNKETKTFEFVRSLSGQMASTRLFNENYFAFRQALTDLAAQDVRLVLISGDYTDDGQALNLKATQELLTEFEQRYGMRFLLTNGNHEAVNQLDRESGKSDFLTQKGAVIGVYSAEHLVKKKEDLLYPEMRELGYESMYPFIQNFGLQPRETDLFYTTPFQPFAYESYKKGQEFRLTDRKYESQGVAYFDFTYLVEPLDGVWILAIDGNMYQQVNETTYKNKSDGYHQIEERMYLLHWIKTVVNEAKLRGKKLLAFGHYPLLDFNANQTTALLDVLGKNQFQLHRVPTSETQLRWLETGLSLHFAGHMHIHQETVKKHGDLELKNIQVPSLAAFPPAYKIVEIEEEDIDIQTVELKEVQHFDALFSLYQKENTQGKYDEFLQAKNYYALTKSHLKYLSEHRFYHSDFGDVKWTVYKEATSLDAFMPPEMLASLTKASLREAQRLDFKTLLFDLYLLRNGSDIGRKEIDPARIELYVIWNQWITKQEERSDLDKLIEIMVGFF